MPGLDDRVTELLGAAPIASATVHGGDVSDARRIDLDDGRTVFAKTHAAPPDGFFSTEAAGLAWLRAAGAVAVPEVLGVTDDPPAVLVLEWIEEGAPTAATEPALGEALADLHRSGAAAFGREDRRTTGSLALSNDPCATWAEFYAERRLRPLARIASDRDALDPRTVTGLEAVADRLDVVGGPAEPPARLHGDLWAGNRLVDTVGRNWLIDPAAHGGHREFDLAMMRLFGGYGAACFHAYDERHPLADDWHERIELHQLAPLVVHAIKFGSAYVSAVRRAVDAYR